MFWEVSQLVTIKCSLVKNILAWHHLPTMPGWQETGSLIVGLYRNTPLSDYLACALFQHIESIPRLDMVVEGTETKATSHKCTCLETQSM